MFMSISYVGVQVKVQTKHEPVTTVHMYPIELQVL